MRYVLLSLLAAFFFSSAPAGAQTKPPGFSTIQRLCKKTRKMRNPRAQSRGVATGDGRFFSVVQHQDKGKTTWYLHLVQLEKKDASWTITGLWPLAMKSKIRGGNPESPASLCSLGASEWKPASALFIRDYDGDGKLELLLRLKFCWMIPAIGATSVRTMQIFNVTPKAIRRKPALDIEIEHDARPTAMGRRLGRYTFKDLDGDGHPDLRLRVTYTYGEFIKSVAHQCTERTERRFLWKKAGDRYVEIKMKRKRLKRRCRKAS